MRESPRVARQIVVAIVLLAAVALIAFLGSMATLPNTDGWYATVAKVPWNPPNWVFGPAWSILYILIALAGWLIWRGGWRAEGTHAARPALTAYVIQLVLNALWTPVFFAGYPLVGESAWWIALAVILLLIVSVIWLIASARRTSQLAAWALVPYLVWLVFASSLNVGIIVLN